MYAYTTCRQPRIKEKKRKINTMNLFKNLIFTLRYLLNTIKCTDLSCFRCDSCPHVTGNQRMIKHSHLTPESSLVTLCIQFPSPPNTLNSNNVGILFGLCTVSSFLVSSFVCLTYISRRICEGGCVRVLFIAE